MFECGHGVVVKSAITSDKVWQPCTKFRQQCFAEQRDKATPPSGSCTILHFKVLTGAAFICHCILHPSPSLILPLSSRLLLVLVSLLVLTSPHCL